MLCFSQCTEHWGLVIVDEVVQFTKISIDVSYLALVFDTLVFQRLRFVLFLLQLVEYVKRDGQYMLSSAAKGLDQVFLHLVERGVVRLSK